MARKERFINIKFPFQDSKEGFLLDLNQESKDALRSDLMHLLFASKNKRLYNPDFGTNLRRFLFEPMDGVTIGEIKTNINEIIVNHFPGVKVNNITVDQVDETHSITVKVEYTATDGVFSQSDFFEVTF